MKNTMTPIKNKNSHRDWLFEDSCNKGLSFFSAREKKVSKSVVVIAAQESES